MSNIPICRVILEELGLACQGIGHTLCRHDVLLAAIDDSYEAKFERIDSPSENVQCVGSSIHKIELRKNTDCPSTLGIYGPSNLERFRVRQVHVCGRYSEDYTAQSMRSKS